MQLYAVRLLTLLLILSKLVVLLSCPLQVLHADEVVIATLDEGYPLLDLLVLGTVTADFRKLGLVCFGIGCSYEEILAEGRISYLKIKREDIGDLLMQPTRALDLKTASAACRKGEDAETYTADARKSHKVVGRFHRPAFADLGGYCSVDATLRRQP